MTATEATQGFVDTLASLAILCFGIKDAWRNGTALEHL